MTEIKELAAEKRHSHGEAAARPNGSEAQPPAKIEAGAAAPLRPGPSGPCFRPPGPLRSELMDEAMDPLQLR